VFSTSPVGDLTGKVCLTNTSGKPLGYKIKTTSPEKYRVRPSTGCISPGQSVTVEIHVSGQKEVSSLNRDKFLVTAVLLDREDIPAPQLTDALRTQTPDGQYRLRCNLAGAPETGSGIGQVYASPPPAAAPEDPARQVANVSKKVAQLVEGQQQLAGQVKQLHLLLLLMLILLLATLLVLLYRLPSSVTSAVCTAKSKLLSHPRQCQWEETWQMWKTQSFKVIRASWSYSDHFYQSLVKYHILHPSL